MDTYTDASLINSPVFTKHTYYTHSPVSLYPSLYPTLRHSINSLSWQYTH